MKVIIAGSRGITDYKVLDDYIKHEDLAWTITEVVSGGAIGPDRLGERYAARHRLPVKRFLPDWEFHGKKAGFLRNAEMAQYADGLIALWDGVSRGTAHMITTMGDLGKPLMVCMVESPPRPF